ncbi:hypothetical protein ES703_45290 [subsurface metagenome]
MPLPPPPKAAFIITGKPISLEIFSPSLICETDFLLPGMTGIPASSISFLAQTLSPIFLIISKGGPINSMPFDSHISANWGFSARNPYPGWIASQFVTRQALIISFALR